MPFVQLIFPYILTESKLPASDGVQAVQAIRFSPPHSPVCNLHHASVSTQSVVWCGRSWVCTAASAPLLCACGVPPLRVRVSLTTATTTHGSSIIYEIKGGGGSDWAGTLTAVRRMAFGGVRVPIWDLLGSVVC